ncbi:MAG: prepilin-type N-terminal cleavage/methylation domain-containing protein [Pseudomonadota bacterium]
MSSSAQNSVFRAKLSQQLLDDAQGFTLIELLVVIVIVGVLSAVAVPTFLNQVQRSRFAEGESGVATGASALTVYAFDCGDYGSALTDVDDLLTTIACNGATAPDEGPWMEQPWSTLAPNYSLATIVSPGATGAQVSTAGITGAYAGINCVKGVGDAAAAGDGCD